MNDKRKQNSVELPVRQEGGPVGDFIEFDSPMVSEENEKSKSKGGKMDTETAEILRDDRISHGG